MDKMENFLKQEVEDFKNGRSPVQNVLKVIDQREKCLAECVEISKKLGDASPEQSEELLQEMDKKLKELRQLGIKTVENVVLWRDQFRSLAMTGSNQKSIKKRKAQNAI